MQTFSYLYAQLCGDAALVIVGFQLTNSNFDHSIALLKERFVQIYKHIEAHMQVLIDSLNLNNTLSNLPESYNTTEGHNCSLTTLRKPMDLYGSLIVPILLDKLPPKTKQNLNEYMAEINGLSQNCRLQYSMNYMC